MKEDDKAVLIIQLIKREITLQFPLGNVAEHGIVISDIFHCCRFLNEKYFMLIT